MSAIECGESFTARADKRIVENIRTRSFRPQISFDMAAGRLIGVGFNIENDKYESARDKMPGIKELIEEGIERSPSSLYGGMRDMVVELYNVLSVKLNKKGFDVDYIFNL